MAAPNLTQLATSTHLERSSDVHDLVTDNNALLAQMKMKGKIKLFRGGREMVHNLAFKENTNAAWFSGAEEFPIDLDEHLTAATYTMKEAVATTVITGRERLLNRGPSAQFELLSEKMENTERTMENFINRGCYSAGTGFGGREIGGLQLLVPIDVDAGTVGGISRVTYDWWRSQYDSTAVTKANVRATIRKMWTSLKRGMDAPDFGIAGDTFWLTLYDSFDDGARFMKTGSKMAKLGWKVLDVMGIEIVLDGGQGGQMPANSCYLLNCNYLKYRPHADQNFTPLPGGRRTPTNQNAVIVPIGWAGNLTCGGLQFQGRIGSN